MAIKYTKNANSGSLDVLIEEGDYEVVVERAEERTAVSTGKDYITLMLKIRDDVEQKFQNRTIFYSIFKDKDNPNQYNEKKINRLLDCLPEDEIQDGQAFEEVQDFLNLVKGMYLIAHIKVGFSEYKNADENYIAYIKTTKHPSNKLNNNQQVEISIIEDDKDLPF